MSYSKIGQLVKESKGGNSKAIQELIKTYDKLIKKYVDTYFIKGYDDEDLEQIAKLTIIKAISIYNEETGANFTGFLNVVLRNTFTVMINKKENTVKTYSLNKYIYDSGDDAKEYQDILVDDINIEEDTIEIEDRMRLRNAINKLSAEEKELLIVAFSGHGKLKEYSKSIGITYKQARYGRDKILRKVKKFIKVAD